MGAGHEDNAPAGAARDHFPERQPCRTNLGDNLGFGRLAPQIVGHVDKRRGPGPAGVRDKDVDPTLLVRNLIDHLGDRVRIGHVGDNAFDGAARLGADFADRLLQPFGIPAP